MTARVVHDEASSAYRLFDGHTELAHAEYRTTGSGADTVLVFHHTYTYPEHRGNGYAAQIVTAALDAVLASGGARVVPQCWLVADVIAADDRYAPLLT